MIVFFSASVANLHREFMNAGSDVLQAYTHYASDDRLSYRGNDAKDKYTVSTSIYFRFV